MNKKMNEKLVVVKKEFESFLLELLNVFGFVLIAGFAGLGLLMALVMSGLGVLNSAFFTPVLLVLFYELARTDRL